MDQLWAPWRMKYVEGIDSPKNKECIFCAKPKQQNDKENLILFRGTHCFVILNLYPYNNGHLMVVPYRHTADCADLSAEESGELWSLIVLSKRVLLHAFHPEGFNIGMNMGRTAGAGIDQHIHMHIVPRWNGDTNFMSVIGDTKVISQGFPETYDTLKPLFMSQAV